MMESQQLVHNDLMTATLLPTPVDLSTVSQEKHENTSPGLLGLPKATVPLQKTVISGSDILSIAPLLENNGDSVWMNNPVQYVVLQKDEQETTSQTTHNTTALTDQHKEDRSITMLRMKPCGDCLQPPYKHNICCCEGIDRLQCGLCGKIQNNVLLFLHHKSSHVARGMGLGCEICGLSFSRQLALTEHYRRKHRILLNEIKHKRETNRCVKTHKKSPHSNTQSFLSQTSIQTTYNSEILTDSVKSKSSELVQLNEDNDQNAMYLSGSILPISKTVLMETSVSIVDNKVSENVVVCLNSDVSTSVNEETVATQNNYPYNSTRHESLLGASNIKLPYKNHVACENTMENVRQEVRYKDRENLTIESTCDIESVPAEATVVIGTEEIKVPVNSDSSEKENVEDQCDNEIQTHENHENKTSEDITLDQTVSLSNTSNRLRVEMNMPDFHFIPVIEKSNKRSVIQGGRYSFKCLYCDVKVSWRSTMCKHMKEKHSDILKVGNLLNIPDKINGEHKVMKMSDYMRTEFKPSGKKIRGVESQDLPGEYLCDKCDKMFYRLRYLRKHQKIHKTEKDLLCSMCVKSFKTMGNLKQHMKSHRNREAYKCSECDFESNVNIAIHAHRQIHCKGCVLCEVCGFAYSDKSTLAKHKEVHNPMRPFACRYPGCTWRFNSIALCNAHFRAHTTKGDFECRVCCYAFRQKHHLQRHERKVHNIIEERKLSYSYYKPSYTRDEEDEHLSVRHSSVAVQEMNLDVNEGNHVTVDTVEDQFNLENALQSGVLVIATDDGNTINCEMSDMGMNMTYQTLLHDGDTGQLDSHTILIPQTDGSHIVYQHEHVAETVSCTEESVSTEVE